MDFVFSGAKSFRSFGYFDEGRLYLTDLNQVWSGQNLLIFHLKMAIRFYWSDLEIDYVL